MVCDAALHRYTRPQNQCLRPMRSTELYRMICFSSYYLSSEPGKLVME